MSANRLPISAGSGEGAAFGLLVDVVNDLSKNGSPVFLSGLKNQLRKKDPTFSEKKYGYSGFLQFCKAAATRGRIELTWDQETGDYKVSAT